MFSSFKGLLSFMVLSMLAQSQSTMVKYLLSKNSLKGRLDPERNLYGSTIIFYTTLNSGPGKTVIHASVKNP